MGQSITILCLGDSLTDGANSHYPSYPYSTEFPMYLKGVAVTNEGWSGYGSKDLKDKLEESLARKQQDIVCFMAGTNDLMMTPAAEVIEVLVSAWKMALAKGCRVVALTVLEGNLSQDYRDNYQELNRLIHRSVKDIDNEKLTCYDACLALPSQQARPDLWGDPIHPVPSGYRMLGHGLALYLRGILIDVEAKATKRSMFRPCIDLHSGVVKQIVGGTLSGDVTSEGTLKTNFVSEQPASYYAEMYRKNNLTGGHVIMLGPNCTEAAESALQIWPGGLQVGGGINDSNAARWLAAGAEKVILTSWLFPDGVFSIKRLGIISNLVGSDRLVIDLSCRLNQGESGWTVAMNKWQTLTTLKINGRNLDLLKTFCSEFLIHAADVEGLQNGVDEHLVEYLGLWAAKQEPPFKITYAGGARSIEDLEAVNRLSGGYVDLTIGSALDIFGGSGATMDECIKWNLQ